MLNLRFISLILLIGINQIICKDDNSNFELEEIDTDEKNIKQYGKRLETIDGVEIASSYKEYLDLALGDLEDRLRKSSTKLADFKQRILRRTNLFKEIENEIERRREYSQELSNKDKLLRGRLIRNTQMKSALENLANIAGYKLSSADSAQFYSDANRNELLASVNDSLEYENPSQNNNTLAEILLDKSFVNEKSKNMTTYTKYIEMAYAEVNSILKSDKQTLIDVIRRLKTNDLKLVELVKLKANVNEGLIRLNKIKNELTEVSNHDRQISNTVKQLKAQIILNDKIKMANDDIDETQQQQQQQQQLNEKQTENINNKE